MNNVTIFKVIILVICYLWVTSLSNTFIIELKHLHYLYISMEQYTFLYSFVFKIPFGLKKA